MPLGVRDVGKERAVATPKLEVFLGKQQIGGVLGTKAKEE